MTNGNGQELVSLTIDGKEVTVPKGTLIIRAAEELGIEIPRFCDHPLLEPVAACRQCYVKVEGQRKLMTSCSTPVADGLVVQTQFTDDEVKDAQVSVLEFLLINHPLDCPVCDRGGECPLQDQALAFGPGESRYVEAKRTYRKPLPLSPLVALDRERCVLCARCTRFCDEISGDRFIELFDRGAAEQVSIAPGEDFKSPFSGNTIQICPVGALTATPYRFAARPFDLKSGDSVCPHCASGCNIRVDLRRGEVVRHLARDNYDVNDAWLCDKGRFAFTFPDNSNRLTAPLLRDPGLEPVSFGEVLSTVASWCGEKRVAVLAGGRLSDEDAYALSKLARTAFQTNDIDHRVTGGDPSALAAEQVQAAGMPVTYQDVERAKAIVVVGLDAEQELPILHLRIRKAVRKTAARVFVIHPRRTRLWEVGEHLLCRPGEEAALLSRIESEIGTEESGEPASDEARLASALREAGEAGIVFGGPSLLGSEGAVEAARTLAAGTSARFSLVCRRANDRGALRAGLHPALLPGGKAVEDDAQRSMIEVAWGTLLPNRRGRDTREIIEAAANKEIDVLFLVGVDPLTDFPNASLVRQALQNVPYKVVVDISSDAMQIYADAMLPGTPYLEKDGHYSNWEGRPQRLRPVRPPIGLARPEWEIFQELSKAIGADMGFHSLNDLHEEMGRVLGAAAEVGATRGGHSPPFPTAPDASPPPQHAHGPNASARGAGGTRQLEQPPRGEVTLFTYPLLVDEGTLSKGADLLKEALEEPAFVEVNTADAERLGLVDGEPATVRTDAGEATLPVRVTPHIVEGAAFVPFNQPRFAINTILSGRLVTRAAVEPAEAKVNA